MSASIRSKVWCSRQALAAHSAATVPETLCMEPPLNPSSPDALVGCKGFVQLVKVSEVSLQPEDVQWWQVLGGFTQQADLRPNSP